MSKDAIDNNLRQVIRDLTRRISALERQQQDVGQLSELSSDMGLQLAGEFRAGNGVEPGEGFSGVRMTADGVSGYDNDVLQSQMSATDGMITAGAGDVILDVTGITLAGNYGSSYISSNSLKWIDGSDTLASIAQASAGVGGTELTLKMTAENLLLDGDVSATKLNMGDTGAITGGSESLADDTVVSFTPVIDRGLIIVYVGAADEQAMVIYNTSTPGTWGMLLGADMVITTGALTDGTTDGTDAKWNISCHTDGKIYIKNRTGSTKVVRWNLFGGV